MIEKRPQNVDPACDITGRCEGQKSQRKQGTCSCTHCGKELQWTLGAWWTWDASYSLDPRPQDEDPNA